MVRVEVPVVTPVVEGARGCQWLGWRYRWLRVEVPVVIERKRRDRRYLGSNLLSPKLVFQTLSECLCKHTPLLHVLH